MRFYFYNLPSNMLSNSITEEVANLITEKLEGEPPGSFYHTTIKGRGQTLKVAGYVTIKGDIHIHIED